MSEDETRKEMLSKTAARVSSYALGSHIRPIDLLKDSIKNHEWFKGLVLSGTFFEMFGFITLKTYYEQKKKREYNNRIGTFLDRVGLTRIIMLLYLCDFIKPSTYAKMVEIIKTRNKIIHRVRRIDKDFAFEDEISHEFKEKAIKLIGDAIKCLKELGVT